MRLVLIRHGQTDSNVRGLLDTAPPGPGLTELGREQAAAVPGALAHLRIGAVYSSDQTRAQQTAAPLAAANVVQVKVRPGLREIQAAELEMRADHDSVRQYLTVVGSWLGGDLELRMPGAAGENGHEVLARMDRVVAEAVGAALRKPFESADGTTDPAIAMVAHGAILRFWAAVRSVNLPASYGARAPLHNTGIIELDGDLDAWRVLHWAGTAVGGEDLDDAAADGPAGEPVPMRSSLPSADPTSGG